MQALHQVICRCLDQLFSSSTSSSMELEELCMLFLRSTLELSQGKYGYVACGSVLEPEKMKCMAAVNMELYLKHQDIKWYKPNRTFFTPPHLRDKWILIPLMYHGTLHGVMGFENATNQPHSQFKEYLQPLVPRLASLALDSYMTARVTATQQDLFLGTVSHEIRTPLNGIVGMSRMLKESCPLTTEQKSYINVVSECTYQLLELINDILDFSKMDCDQLTLNSEPVDIRSCMEEVYDLVYLRAQEKKLNLWYQVDPTIPFHLMGDKKRIRQILLNLINNAIKFTERGQIDVNVYGQANGLQSNSTFELHVEVKDTGVGIPESHRDNVFKSFQQVRTQKPNADGVGLGLALCKKLCTLMGGHIEIKSSVVGQGTCMHFMLPLAHVMEKKLSTQELNMNNKRVLIIDPQLPRRMQWLAQLTQWKFHPYACGSVDEAQLYLQTFSIDLVLMESNATLSTTLPTGYLDKLSLSDFPLFVSQLNWKRSEPKRSLSFSSNSPEEEKSKGLTPEESRTRELRPEESRTRELRPPFPLDILVVEDNPYNMMVICEMLKKLGYEDRSIDKATNGAEAIQKAISKQYDVILMDLLLPLVDGMAATTQILNYYKARCPKKLKYVMDKYESLLPTVVALTALVTTDTQTKCKTLGFKGFLTKPLDKEELETMLGIIAKRRQLSRKNLSTQP